MASSSREAHRTSEHTETKCFLDAALALAPKPDLVELFHLAIFGVFRMGPNQPD
jgi:hypothetical protein